jgi:hypothetical protein
VYINRTLLLLMAFAIIFIPSAQEWVLGGGTAWYRPFLVWGLMILLVWWNQRKSYSDDI